MSSEILSSRREVKMDPGEKHSATFLDMGRHVFMVYYILKLIQFQMNHEWTYGGKHHVKKE